MIISRNLSAAAAIAALLITGGAVAATGAAAQPKEKAPRACFFPRDVQSWSSGKEKAVKDKTVNFRVGASRYFQGKLATSCPDIDWTYKIGFDPRGQISVCEGQEAELIVPGPSIGPRTCLMTDIKRLTKEEVAALPKGTKP